MRAVFSGASHEMDALGLGVIHPAIAIGLLVVFALIILAFFRNNR